MKTAYYSIIVMIIVFIMVCMIISDKEEIQDCHINYNTKYVKVKTQPIKVEPPIVSYERFYDENMLVNLDSSLFDESRYKTIMKHTDNGALL